MSLSRADNSAFARWWWTVDRVALAGVFALIAVGLVLAFAASPAATGSAHSAGNFTYALKQVGFAATAIVILIGASLLDPKQMRTVAAAVFALALIGAGIALLLGADVNGAHRWLNFGEFKLEPSEFLKPAFAILAAAFLTDKLKRGFPGELVTLIVLAPALGVLLFQPDVGQTALLTTLCVAMLFFAGLAYYWIAALGAGGAALATIAYFLHPHVRERIAAFLNHDGPGYQAGLALKAFEAGGITGVGPGAGTIKYRLPDAHTDFIFAVAGEEFGIALCADRGAVRRGDHPASAARVEGEGSVCAIGGRRACARHRAAGVHQHGRGVVHPAGQGHDAALRFLWRLVAVRGGADAGSRARRYAPAPANSR